MGEDGDRPHLLSLIDFRRVELTAQCAHRLINFVSTLYNPGRDLRPGVEAKFRQDVLHVTLRSARCDHQAVGDGLIGQAFGDQVGDLALPLRQSHRRVCVGCGDTRRLLLEGVGDSRGEV
jgi:hypothetical protein